LTRRVGQRASTSEDYPSQEKRLAEVMSKIRVSERSDPDTGEAVDGTSDMLMDMIRDMVMAVTPITAETAGEIIFQLMERNKNRKGRRRSEDQATAGALGDWRSHMQRAALQEACELAYLYLTIATMANVLEARTALQEALWRWMRTWLEEIEK